MNTDVVFAFSAFQLTFLLLDIYILSKTGRDIARKGEYIWFCVLTLTHMVYLVFNCIWTLREYDVLRISHGFLMLICTVSLWSVTNCAAAFFLFIVEKLGIWFFQSGAGRWLRLLPSGISTLLIVTNLWTGLVFSLNGNGYIVHEGLYLLTILTASLYLLAAAAAAAVNVVRARTTFQRQANASVFGSVLIIILFVVFDGLMTKASILPAAIFAAIAVIFITMQESNINSDALTGMNNRRKASEYLSDRLDNVSESDPLYLFMGDLDGFKQINDTYGHSVGDEALLITSRALKRTISHYNGFAARYGGDEFLMSWQAGNGKEGDPEQFILDVNACLEELSEGKPYELTMSIGYTRCADPKEGLSACIKQADEMLYRRKTLTGVGR